MACGQVVQVAVVVKARATGVGAWGQVQVVVEVVWVV